MSQSRLLGGILLVAGTAIGAGMLALPVSTSLVGFYPSLLIFLVSWIFMTFSAFLILEVALSLEGGTNLISMADKTLGIWGKYLSGSTYLFLLYALVTAYIGGLSGILKVSFEAMFGFSLVEWAAPIPVLIIFGSFVHLGVGIVDYLNRFLMGVLILSFILSTCMLPQYVNVESLSYVDWKYSAATMALVVTSFGYHVVIPSLVIYMQYDVKSLKRALLLGSLIPLLVYCIWEFLVLGAVPLLGPGGLIEALKLGLPATEPIKAIAGTSWIAFVVCSFAFLCIVTSFLGVSLSLSDFIADGLKIDRSQSGKLLVSMLTFIPPLAFTLTDPRGFYVALEYAGIFVAILLGLLPIMMAWRGRYYIHLKSPFTVPGGRMALTLGLVFFVLVIFLEVGHKLDLYQFEMSQFLD